MIYLKASMVLTAFLLSYIISVVVYDGSMAGKYSIKPPVFLKKNFLSMLCPVCLDRKSVV